MANPQQGSDESGQKKIESQLDELQLTEDGVDKDGNCMFESIARQIDGMNHQTLRDNACDHLQSHCAYYQPYVYGDFENQLNEFRQDGVYANAMGDIMLEVIHHITTKHIIIIRDLQNPTSYPPEANITNSTIVIVGRVNHYNSTKLKPKSTASDPKREPKSEEMLDMAPNDKIDKCAGSGIAGLNVNGWLSNGGNKKVEVEKLINPQTIDILVIGESHLQGTLDEQGDQHEQLKIDGFSYVRFDRTQRGGGGLIIYIRENIQFCVTSFYEWTNKSYNIQYVELAITYPFRFDLVAMYSPPNDKARILAQRLMAAFLARNGTRTPVMFIGDMNIARNRDKCVKGVPGLDWIDPDTDRNGGITCLFNCFDENHSAKALINEPTSCKGKCIDHIITNVHTIPAGTDVAVTGSGVIPSPHDNIDHNLIWCKVYKQSAKNEPQLKYYLLRFCNGKWVNIEISSKGKCVGKCENLSKKAELIIEQIKRIQRPEDGGNVLCEATNCTKGFDSYYAIENHERSKHFPCPVCFKILKSKYYGAHHMENIHKIFLCRNVHCNNRRFNTFEERNAHELGEHLVCTICERSEQKAFSNDTGCKIHLNKIHDIKLPPGSSSKTYFMKVAKSIHRNA